MLRRGLLNPKIAALAPFCYPIAMPIGDCPCRLDAADDAASLLDLDVGAGLPGHRGDSPRNGGSVGSGRGVRRVERNVMKQAVLSIAPIVAIPGEH